MSLLSTPVEVIRFVLDAGLIGGIIILARDSIANSVAIKEAREAINFLRKALPRETLTSWDQSNDSTVVGVRRALPGPQKTRVWSKNEPKLPSFNPYKDDGPW